MILVSLTSIKERFPPDAGTTTGTGVAAGMAILSWTGGMTGDEPSFAAIAVSTVTGVWELACVFAVTWLFNNNSIHCYGSRRKQCMQHHNYNIYYRIILIYIPSTLSSTGDSKDPNNMVSISLATWVPGTMRWLWRSAGVSLTCRGGGLIAPSSGCCHLSNTCDSNHNIITGKERKICR